MMKTIRPDTPKPIPLRAKPPRPGNMVLRLMVLLGIMALVGALLWLR